MFTKKIMIVEDDSNTREIYVEMLVGCAGVCVIEFEKIKPAVDFLGINHVDLIMLDMKLPDGKGEELFPLIQKRKIPVIIVSGYVSEFIADEMTLKSVHEMMQKPFSFIELKKHVERMLQ